MLLLLIMNLGFAAGTVVVPPTPPTPIDSSDGFRRGHKYEYADEQKDREEKIRKQLLEEDEVVLAVIMSAMNIIK